MTTCVICLEDVIDIKIELPCKHIYCFLCIKSYSSKISVNGEFKCPLCRENIIWKTIKKKIDIETIEKYDGPIWLYSGKNVGYWKYSIIHMKELEKLYKKFIDNNTNNDIVDNKDDDDVYKILICSNIYIIDFKNMKQINSKNNATRKIKRIINDNNDHEINIKGIIGLTIT